MILKFAVVVPTLNPGPGFVNWLNAFKNQTIVPNNSIIVDSSSTDGYVELAHDYGFDIVRISRSEFNHGATRQMIANDLTLNVDIIIYLTQDAILADENSFHEILSSFESPAIYAAYGRQLPYPGANAISSHARLYNYPNSSRIQSFDSYKSNSFKCCFISNSFAAYRVTNLISCGGFPLDVILGEDTCVAAKMLTSGGKIAYVSTALVYHSHEYTFMQEFSRYFDIGVLHQDKKTLFKKFKSANAEGLNFVLSEMRFLSSNSPSLIPAAFLFTFVKFIGYKLGKHYKILPKFIIRRLSMHTNYWART